MCPPQGLMESTGEPSPLSAPMCPWCPGGLPMVLGLLPHRPALWVAVLAMHSAQSLSGTQHFLMQFCPWTTTGSSCSDQLLSSFQAGPYHPFLCPHECQVLSEIWEFWGTLPLPAARLCPPLPPRLWLLYTRLDPPELSRVPGRQGRCLTGSRYTGAHTTAAVGLLIGGAVLSLPVGSLLSPCRNLQPQVEGQRLPPGFEASALPGPEQ